MQEESGHIKEDKKCSNEKCCTEIQCLKFDISKVEKQISAAKDKYHKSLVLNLKKDIMIDELEKQLASATKLEFEEFFSQGMITTLRSINGIKKKDSNFILTAVKDMYRDDVHRLKGKTFSGRTKEKMTPKKVVVLKALFKERLKNLPDSDERMKNFGKCVKAAIENINNTKLK